jgi:DNA invertase Pin-like site-specific DNA recombinase
MMRKVIRKIDAPPALETPKRVAAYARVSSGKDAMLHSLSAQVSYYSDLIQKHPGWQYAGVFADEALTGTKEERPEFQRLLKESREGKIDMVLCKSISRMARNTVTLLETVRELKSLGVDVYFEEQNIHTSSTEGELLLTILASYAQEESRSASENQKWRVRRNFENGMPWNGTMLGYRNEQGVLKVVPEEAEIVKFIFESFLAGNGKPWIAKALNQRKITTRFGKQWTKTGIDRVLRNYSYTGNLLLQTTFSENHITKAKCVNTGQLPKFHVEESHEAIIPVETFEAVREEMSRRAEHYPNRSPSAPSLRGKVICGLCGKHCRHKITNSYPMWICGTYVGLGKDACPAKAVPESVVDGFVEEFGGTERISRVTVFGGNRLVFTLADGTEAERLWKDRSRSESWTPEMRKAAGDKTRERKAKRCRE